MYYLVVRVLLVVAVDVDAPIVVTVEVDDIPDNGAKGFGLPTFS